MKTFQQKQNYFLFLSFLLYCYLGISFQSISQTIKVCYKSSAGATFLIDKSYRLDFDNKLTNPIYFGPTGLSKYSFQMHDFGTNPVTYTALVSNGCQIFDAGLNNTDAVSGVTTYTSAEATDLLKWSTDANKGLILGFQDWAGYWASGHVVTGTNNVNPNNFTILGQKIFNGPFGATTSFNQGGSFQGTFSTIPSTSCGIIQSSNGQISGVLSAATGDIYLADVGMLSTVGGMSTGNAIANNQDVFAMNLYHGLAKLVTFKPSNACTFFACDSGTDAPNFGNTNLISNSCPTETVNLTSLIPSNTPTNMQVTWHTSVPANNANKIPDPTTYSPSVSVSTVYAAFHDSVAGCYSGDGYAVEDMTVEILTCSAGAIDCNKTQIYKAPVSGSPAEHTLIVSVNVTQTGCFKPISVSGSGMSLLTSPYKSCTTTTGVQQFHIPIKYDGSALGTMNFTIGAAGSCAANLTTAPKKALVDTWTLDCIPTAAPSLK